MITTVALAVLVFIANSFAGEVEDKFKEAKIVDDLLAKAPDSVLDVEFDCGFTTLGNKFAPIQVRNLPKITWKGAKEDDFYTIIMTDIERKNREWIHWLAANVQGMNIDKSDILTAFFPSAPPKDSGEHRYVFLLYKQPGKLDLQGQEKISTFQMENRENWSTKTFVEKFKLGSPVAGNFYLASWDETCEELYKIIEKNSKKN